MRVGPATSNEGAMPAEDGRGGDEERRSPLAGHQLGQCGDARSIRPGEGGPAD